MDLTSHRRDLNRGFGDTLARSFEFAATLALFTVLGWLLDRWLGTMPWFTVGLAVFALAGLFIKFWYVYDAEMTREQARFEEGRRR